MSSSGVSIIDTDGVAEPWSSPVYLSYRFLLNLKNGLSNADAMDKSNSTMLETIVKRSMDNAFIIEIPCWQTGSSGVYAGGKGLLLQWLAMVSPWAPAERMATKALCIHPHWRPCARIPWFAAMARRSGDRMACLHSETYLREMLLPCLCDMWSLVKTRCR